LLADGSSTFREGLRADLVAGNGLRLVGETATGAATVERSRALHPQVVVLDTDLPDADGLDVCRRLVKQCHATTVVLTSYWDWDIHLAGALDAGAAGFLLKRTPPAELVRSIRQAASRPIFTPGQLKRIHLWERSVGARLRGISLREWDVLWLTSTGKSNREIAEALMVSESTVEKHISTLLRKLDVSSRSGLLAYVLQHHLNSGLRALASAP
jgi:DNA-binding NarL/FixJ family response regulator